MRERVLGAEHPDTLASIDDLTLIYRNQERWTESETEDSKYSRTSRHPYNELCYIVSDSGYALMGIHPAKQSMQEEEKETNNDIETVLTDNEHLVVQPDLREKLSVAFAKELFQVLESEIYRLVPAEHLKDFSLKLRQKANSGQQKDATVFVRHYRKYVSSSYCVFLVHHA